MILTGENGSIGEKRLPEPRCLPLKIQSTRILILGFAKVQDNQSAVLCSISTGLMLSYKTPLVYLKVLVQFVPCYCLH